MTLTTPDGEDSIPNESSPTYWNLLEDTFPHIAKVLVRISHFRAHRSLGAASVVLSVVLGISFYTAPAVDANIFFADRARGQSNASITEPTLSLTPSSVLEFSRDAQIDPEDITVSVNTSRDVLQPTSYFSLNTNTTSEDQNALQRITQDDEVLYVVRNGEKLSDIAQLFGVSSSTIRSYNGLRSNSVNAGTELLIPGVDGIPYTVQRGDTLASIAKKLRAEADRIAYYNQIASTDLSTSLELFIPNGKEPPKPKPKPKPAIVSPASAGTAPTSTGSFGRPVNARINSSFRSNSRPNHQGVDFAAPTGTPVYASASGTVKKSQNGWNGGFGNVIEINHGGSIVTRYAHLSKRVVSNGETVKKGQVIGYVGSTGRSTGPHLHFEVLVNGVARNPTKYIQ